MYDAKLVKEAAKDEQFPEARGHKLIVALPTLKEKTEGGVLLPDQLIEREQLAAICGFVISMGDECYKDSSGMSFPGTPYCKLGDWVMFRSYTGTRFTYRGERFLIINDDSVEAVVKDPRGIART